MLRTVISPLEHSDRTHPIERLDVVFELKSSLWDPDIEPNEREYVQFRAGTRSLCAACIRLKVAGVVQNVSPRITAVPEHLSCCADCAPRCMCQDPKARFTSILRAVIREALPDSPG